METKEEHRKNWYVLYVKTRQELKVSDRLKGIGIKTYVPYRTEIRQWSDRKKKVNIPLLPSMVLVYIEESEASKVFSIPGSVRFLFEEGVRAQISEKEIKALEYYVAGKYDVEEQEVGIGDCIVAPLLNQKVEVLKVQGKKCLAKLQQIGALVSFQLR